jgi:hypothetical protein
MRPALAMALLAAAAALPARAGTFYVPYAADEVVGSARYRTEIALINQAASPAQFRTSFVSADGKSQRRQETTVPAQGSVLLTSAAPAGTFGHVEVTGPERTAVTARLVAYGQDGRLLSSALEPVVSADDLADRGQTFQLLDLAATDLFVSRLGVITADGLGSCSFTAYDVGGEELASLTGAAVLSRDLAEPLRALRNGSIAKARLVVTCDVPAYAVAALLTTDGSRTAIHTPDISPLTKRPSCIIWVRDIDLEKIPTPRGFFEILGNASQPGAPPPPR